MARSATLPAKGVTSKESTGEVMTDHQKFLCIHGHFYQPPRENPWLNQIQFQASALPYHDWNERVTRECYGPNTRARLLGEGGRIRALLNNYAYMSFNFGPTLLSWIEKAHPWIYREILRADRISRDLRHGHGNALAQVYNHIIMPLASKRDKLTQIRWGLADFRHRFGRPAEGMWLAETAVDSETLRLMAEAGVKFTILSPDQAAMVRSVGASGREGTWKDVSGGRIDTTRPYRVSLGGGGASIAVFFYHGPISRAVAYEKLLASGEAFMARIQGTFEEDADQPQLVSLATDGESYGHHFKFGDMALAWLFDQLKKGDRMILTNFGEYLEGFPPQEEVRIVENSAWSCAHGVGRWCMDCGCSVGHRPGWNQAWRKPLREGMDWLADRLAVVFDERGGRLFKDPWKTRDAYITLLLHATAENRDRFLDQQSGRPLSREERIEALQLLESQRMALFMFTSCGWFFDDISGLEATQVIEYAVRGIDLVRQWSPADLEKPFVAFLTQARSNDPDYGTGAEVYRREVIPSRIGPSLAAANYGLALLGWRAVTATRTGKPGPSKGIVLPKREAPFQSGNVEGILGEVLIVEPGTGFEMVRTYVAYHDREGFGCLVGKILETGNLDRMADEMAGAISAGVPDPVRTVFERHVAEVTSYAIEDLIPDTRNALISGMFQWLDRQIGKTISGRRIEAEAFLTLLQESGGPLLEAPNHILSILFADELRRIAETVTGKNVAEWSWLDLLAKQAALQQIKLDDPFMKQITQTILGSLMAFMAAAPAPTRIAEITRFLDMCRKIGVEPDLWECQNAYDDLRQDSVFRNSMQADAVQAFDELGERLGFVPL